MKKILVATNNRGKAKEIERIFLNTDFELSFLFQYPKIKDIYIQENAKSFEGNALIKALIIGEKSGILTLADDSGLCVDYLNGAPGIYSARYSKKGDDKSNYFKLLENMKGVPFNDRNCYYICTVAIYNPKNNFVETVSGKWNGKIGTEPKGDKSFGYSPIFLPNEFDFRKTASEFYPEELIEINHRGKAFRKAIEVLKNI
ncbi:RdgB/HAM1 family non-canonical purine NTP pyrophosphatase [bacterium]|nr:RdgB/HAM1 family non-canonical purine NTP pyrophosphatase [bacterium]